MLISFGLAFGRQARVAKWQTRTVQVRVSERTWRFNSLSRTTKTPSQRHFD